MKLFELVDKEVCTYSFFRKSISEKAVNSTWITDLTYNRPNKVLTMKLSNGRTYSIEGITRSLFDAWIKADSKGKYYHDKIRPTYRAKRIK